MTLRGNFTAFYFIELLSGILTAVLFYFFGDIGLLGLLLFFAGLILTLKKDVDEREIYMSYKINSYEGALIGAIMALTYFSFPEANWFYVFIVSALVVRGIIGLIAFKMG
ncbi:MAG: hypothetical protein U5K00_23085 [Melioribacteraceae bacterium]|nr:hypothetical protein [Melioribacteraceae bacterium]